MITNYIELTEARDHCKALFPIEVLERVCELKKKTTVLADGVAKKQETMVCMVTIHSTSWEVVDSYNEVKDKINKIRERLANEQEPAR